MIDERKSEARERRSAGTGHKRSVDTFREATTYTRLLVP